ncbi:ribose 5-phosphate isomerase B [Planococcaceae bacterium Storch 2/2-2]|nr:ribose 5-phosphate isomerase B [Planococcaceae bacterium Storch 2/2-2]
MKVAIASDHGGNELRRELIELLKEMNIDYTDLGPDHDESVDYPDYARPVAEGVANGTYDRGILVCGTGIGMSIAANKVEGIRCALVHDVYTAHATREHNNSNIIAMGGRVIGGALGKEIAKTWLEAEFEGGRHERRIDKITAIEQGK